MKVWERHGLTEKEWKQLSAEEFQRIVGTSWDTKPCDICGKPTMVLNQHDGKTWCAEHGGTWRDE